MKRLGENTRFSPFFVNSVASLLVGQLFGSEGAVLSYIEIALINAVFVIPLALVAELAGRVFRRPALTHLLWVLVLVKLVTPPIWQIPIIDRDWLSSTGQQLLPKVVMEADRFEMNQGQGPKSFENSRVSKPRHRPRTLATRDPRGVRTQVSLIGVAAKWIRSENFRHLVMTGLLMVWAIGALAWFIVQGFRCIKFRFSLSQGHSAGIELQRFSDQLARRLGLSHSPTVWLMPGVMSPMLWGNGQSALLIFPEPLLDRLDEEATGTLLTHELAHYRRRDHWVRIVALLATGFFWWHPVVWWARREIEAVEEECCDAIVVKAAAAPPKRYAEAILETVDFLAEHQLRLPALATGLGQVPFLRQRLTWIMRGPRQQDLGYCGRLLCLILACTLPIQPSWLSASSRFPSSQTIPPATRQNIENAPLPSSPSSPTQTPLEIANHPTDASPVQAAAVSPWTGLGVRSHSTDGRFAVVGNKATLTLLDLETGREFDLVDFSIQAMAFAANSYQFATVGSDGILRLWNAETCEVERAWRIPGGTSKSVDISANGQWIATGGRDGIIRIWNESSIQHVVEFPRELAPVNCVRFSPDGDLLAVATGDWMSPQTGRIALFEAATWTERISMNWNSPAAAVAFRTDGQSLMSGDWKGRVARWSLATGELLGLSDGHKDVLASAEFSPNSSPLAEMQVPDLQPDVKWGEAESDSPVSWFLGGWRVNSSPNPPSTLRQSQTPQ